MDTLNDFPHALYLSQLTLDMRQRDVWRLIGNTYDMHRRLSMAFPEAPDGGTGRVLFRMESGKGEANILVQSDVEPDWTRLSGNIVERVLGPKSWRIIRHDKPIFEEGQQFRFRLRANPTYRCAQDDEENKKKKGQRYAHLTTLKQAEWLSRKGEAHGFTIPVVPAGPDWLDPFENEPEDKRTETHYDVRITPLDRLKGYKPGGEEAEKPQRITHYGVDFDGILTVTAPARLAAAVALGIGPAKGFGFGLLSLARASTNL